MAQVNSLRFSAPLSPSQAALRQRPFRVGPWLVEPQAGQLHRQDREPVRLTSEQVLTLVLLADRAGSAVPDDALLATIWPQADGNAEVVHAAIASLEMILDREPASDPSFVRDEDGYRLCAPVELLATESGSWRSATSGSLKAAEAADGEVAEDQAAKTGGGMLWPLAIALATAVILLLVVALN